ncbi:PD-(D/E)XK nuclease family protein [Stetteria hydrogenophila]
MDKREFLELLKRDEEFRYAVAGLLGLEEVLRRLDRSERELVRLREDFNKLLREVREGFKRHDEEIAQLRKEIAELRKEMLEGFKRHDEEIAQLNEEVARLRREMYEGFKRHDEEIAQLRKEMLEGFRRHDEEIAKLRREMYEGFARLERSISALGARWGVMAEEAFREALRGVLERELGLKVARWVGFDEEGLVYGYPESVEVDVAIVDGEVILVEVKSHARASDVYTLKRKALLYERLEGRKPARLILVTPHADEKALKAAEKLGVEVYTKT